MAARKMPAVKIKAKKPRGVNTKMSVPADHPSKAHANKLNAADQINPITGKTERTAAQGYHVFGTAV